MCLAQGERGASERGSVSGGGRVAGVPERRRLRLDMVSARTSLFSLLLLIFHRLLQWSDFNHD